MERARYQRAVASDIRKSPQVVEASDPATREYCGAAPDGPDSLQHLHTRPDSSANPRHIEHDDLRNAGRKRLMYGLFGRCGAALDGVHHDTVSQVETEDDRSGCVEIDVFQYIEG